VNRPFSYIIIFSKECGVYTLKAYECWGVQDKLPKITTANINKESFLSTLGLPVQSIQLIGGVLIGRE
jgi:hypothetical protein